MATAYIYIRCSHVDSAESGLGLAQQEQECRAYYDFLRSQSRDTRELRLFPQVFADIAVSAYQKRSAEFAKRPAGARLLRAVKPGDHIIFARLDRAFRNAVECRNMVNLWTDMGVHVHFVDLKVDTSTAIGVFMMGIMSYVAEWWSSYISERTKEGLRQKVLRDGGKTGQSVTHKLVQDAAGNTQLVEDFDRLARLRYVTWIITAVNPAREAAGMKRLTHPDIARAYEQCQARRQGRKPFTVLSRMELGTTKKIRDELKHAKKIWPHRFENTR